MKVLILENDQYACTSKELPEVGVEYYLEDATKGTEAQNRAFHALVREYWLSGLASYEDKSLLEFRDYIKRDLGAGFESYIYADILELPVMLKKVKKYDSIPKDIRDENRKNPDRPIISGKLKSWSHYTKKERKNTITNLVHEMISAGVASKKFDEILEGIGGWQ